MDEALESAADGNFYKALQSMRKLLPYEELLFEQSATPVAQQA